MHIFYSFIVLFSFWMLLSGKFDVFHLTLGVLSSLLVSFMSADLLFHDQSKSDSRRMRELGRFIAYLPWLGKEIVLSTIHVAYLALHPRMLELIDPQVMQFQSRIKNEIGQVMFANSITLTPGTITIQEEDGEFLVHALSSKTADGLPGEMEERLLRIFGEDQANG
ncbi:Na+/H+ antiporter subunit E [Thermodesulfobacteriota bacterium]